MRNNIKNINIELDRDKKLDEAIFLSLCGLDQMRDGTKMLGMVRLKMAHDLLGKVIDKLEDKS
jgi:hypothetical protein